LILKSVDTSHAVSLYITVAIRQESVSTLSDHLGHITVVPTAYWPYCCQQAISGMSVSTLSDHLGHITVVPTVYWPYCCQQAISGMSRGPLGLLLFLINISYLWLPRSLSFRLWIVSLYRWFKLFKYVSGLRGRGRGKWLRVISV